MMDGYGDGMILVMDGLTTAPIDDTLYRGYEHSFVCFGGIVMKRILFFSIVLIVLTVSLVGCAGASLIGKWKLENGGEELIYEFHPDKTFRMVSPNREEWAIEGTYEVDGDILRMKIMEEQSFTLSFSIKENQLILSEGEDMEDILLRVK